MSERSASVALTLTGTAEAEAGLGTVREGLRGIGDAAEGTSARLKGLGDSAPAAVKAMTLDPSSKRSWNELAADLAKIDPAFAKVGEEGSKVVNVMKIMENAKGPGAIRVAALAAEQSVEKLRETIQKLAQTQGAEGAVKQLTAAVEDLDKAITKNVKRAGEQQDSLEAVKAQATLSAKGFESLTGAAGSLEGMLGKMADSQSKASQSIAKGAFAVIALAAAFKGGYEAGEKLVELVPRLKKLDMSEVFASWIVGISKSQMETEKFNIVNRSAIGIANQHRMALEGARETLDRLVPSFASHTKAQTEAAESTKAFNEYIQKVTASGEPLEKVIKGNERAIVAWANGIRETDGNLGRLTQSQLDAVRAAEKHVKSLDKLKEATQEAYEKQLGKALETIRKLREETEKIVQASDKEAAALERQIRAAKQAGASREELAELYEKYEEAVRKGADAEKKLVEESEKVGEEARKTADAIRERTAADEAGARAGAETLAQMGERTAAAVKEQEAVKSGTEAEKAHTQAVSDGVSVSEKARTNWEKLTGAKAGATAEARRAAAETAELNKQLKELVWTLD